MQNLAAGRIKKELGLEPHPEGGWFVESFRDVDVDGADGRARSTAIYFLLEAGEGSHWHRVTDAVEVWHFYAGSPLVITLSPNGHDAQAHRLGPNLSTGERPQIVVPANCWQTAESLGRWTLVACAVAPAFEFESFEMAPPDWTPPGR